MVHRPAPEAPICTMTSGWQEDVLGVRYVPESSFWMLAAGIRSRLTESVQRTTLTRAHQSGA
jgi:hypothetical protein